MQGQAHAALSWAFVAGHGHLLSHFPWIKSIVIPLAERHFMVRWTKPGTVDATIHSTIRGMRVQASYMHTMKHNGDL